MFLKICKSKKGFTPLEKINGKSISKSKKGSLTGFTLIELIMVMVIIGILAAIVMPKFTQQREGARAAATMAHLQNLRSALSIYYAENGEWPSSVAWTTVSPYIDANAMPKEYLSNSEGANGISATQGTSGWYWPGSADSATDFAVNVVYDDKYSKYGFTENDLKGSSQGQGQ